MAREEGEGEAEVGHLEKLASLGMEESAGLEISRAVGRGHPENLGSLGMVGGSSDAQSVVLAPSAVVLKIDCF